MCLVVSQPVSLNISWLLEQFGAAWLGRLSRSQSRLIHIRLCFHPTIKPASLIFQNPVNHSSKKWKVFSLAQQLAVCWLPKIRKKCSSSDLSYKAQFAVRERIRKVPQLLHPMDCLLQWRLYPKCQESADSNNFGGSLFLGRIGWQIFCTGLAALAHRGMEAELIRDFKAPPRRFENWPHLIHIALTLRYRRYRAIHIPYRRYHSFVLDCCYIMCFPGFATQKPRWILRGVVDLELLHWIHSALNENLSPLRDALFCQWGPCGNLSINTGW